MRAMMLRRLLLWSVLAVVLCLLALAMVIVWKANQREWFIDSAGVSATLDMTLSDTGRWVATGILGALIVLVLLAFVVELATANAARGARHSGPFIPSLEERTIPRPISADAATSHAADEHPTEQVSPSRYESTIVGHEATRRMERSLPSSGQSGHDGNKPPPAGKHVPIPSGVDGQEGTEARHTVDDEAGTSRRTTVRLRPAGRR